MKRLLMKGLAICLCVMLVVLSIPIQIAGAETSLEGWFDEDAITVYLGDITPVSGYVTCNGSDLVQITYQIEGWSGEDDNNRYCTQTTSGKSVDLWDMDQLLLDTTTEPLNVPGNYVLWLVARAEDGYWDKLDSAIVCVEENEDEYDNEWDDDWEDEYDNEWEYDEVETDYEENHSSDRVKSQDTTNVAIELWGMFYDDSVDLTIGDAVRVNGYVSSEGSEIVQVTYQIDGWYGIDENNRYCTQETNSYDLNLADMNSLVLNTNTEPLNMPGTYTLRLVAKTADGTWKKLDSMTVYVRDVFSSNASASEEHAASREPDANSNNSDNVSSLPSAISSSSAVKTVEAANIRAEANKDSEWLGTVPADTVLDYYGYSQKDNRDVAWYLVNYNGMQAWISSSVADVIEKNMQYSHAEDNPAPNASDLENAANSNASFETKPNENTSSLPSEISPDSAVQAFASANVRAEGNKDSESLGTVSADTVLDYYGYSQKDDRGVVWYLVNYQGKRAWISSSVADVIAKSTGTDDVKANTDNQSSNTNSEVIIEGEFGSKSYGMMTGSKLDVYFGATVQNANLHSATINIDGYQNAQYVNKQFSDVGHACSDYLTLDGSVAPLNTPGTYTIKLFIKSDACDANGNLIYKEVDRATLVVQENATNKTEQTTTDLNEKVEDVNKSSDKEMLVEDGVSAGKDYNSHTAIYNAMVIAASSSNKYLSWNMNGTIRYVEQRWDAGQDSRYVSDYWTGVDQLSEGKCTRAAASMALSYIGIDLLPKQMSDGGSVKTAYKSDLAGVSAECCVRGGTTNAISKQYTGIGSTLEEFLRWYNDYALDVSGKYSPVVIHTSRNSGSHAFIIIGREENSEYFYTLDPGIGNGNSVGKVKLTEVDGYLRVNEYQVWDGEKGSWREPKAVKNRYNSNCKMMGIWQYYMN